MISFGVFKSSTEYSLNKDPRCNLKDRVIRHLLSMHRFEYTYVCCIKGVEANQYTSRDKPVSEGIKICF